MAKKDAFDVLVEWQESLDKKLSSEYTKPEEVQGIVGNWHMKMRLHGKPATLMRCKTFFAFQKYNVVKL